ncbi:fatty acid desaturase [Caballeronia telluris]|uniref:Fatty acid desaturase n=1 Tax=Caballeronia telluris TaxID=326475 RepID=A0A158FZ18_9BURK|nr:fatty acid desaturase [Caballeronia telluris]SAL25042.1 fatty acid desaturase [Caballeronia telluris]
MSLYLDDAQRRDIHRLRASWRWRSQWPTWLLIACVYGGWFTVALNARTLGMPLALGALALLSCWYMSLQHELLHGHPTRFPLVNALFGIAPLAVWFPYAVYRESHLRHHDDAHLTDPARDPESFFVSAECWARAGTCLRALFAIRNTLPGRMLIGPAFAIAGTLRGAVSSMARGDWRAAGSWALHGVLLAVLVDWLDRRCGIGWFAFLFGVGYPALALGAIRSFHEHREAADPAARTVINEAGWFWRLLFLNNNYHLVHHDLPHVPWFALPGIYAKARPAYLKRCNGFMYDGYWAMARRVAFAAVAHPVHVRTSAGIPLRPARAGTHATAAGIAAIVRAVQPRKPCLPPSPGHARRAPSASPARSAHNAARALFGRQT